MYAELHCLTNFSFLRGASHPEELVTTAAELGYTALAITDECSFAGIVKAHVAAKVHNIKLIIGSEMTIDDHRLVILAPTRDAYAELSSMITRARRRSEKGEYRIEWSDLPYNQHGLVIWLPSGDQELDHRRGLELSQHFDGRLWIGVQHHLDGTEEETYLYRRNLSGLLEVPLVACGDVHMHSPQRQPLQDVLTATRYNCSVMELGRRRFANAERCLRPLAQLQKLYPPALLAETLHIAEQCTFTLAELRYEYPPEVVPSHLTESEYLRQLVESGAQKRWPKGVTPRIRKLIEHEMALIAEMKYECYFLTIYDIVAYARSLNILCQGRGSAANSVVCYCLFITEVSPDEVSLLFERFISKERDEPPDIDVDFEHSRREEVIQYIYRRYSRERAALAATVITYRPRSAIRDVGKALGLDAPFVEKLSKSLAWWDRLNDLQQRFAENGLRGNSGMASLFFQLVREILGFPRHLSQHVGGFIITKSPISTLVPVENATMPDRTVIQWDKEDIEALGLLKVDILALGMLSAIRRSFELIRHHHQRDLCMQAIPRDDVATFDMLCKGDSVGVFQVESRAQMAMLPRLRPRCYYDLVIEIAIVRPGPIQGEMVHPFLRRRQGKEAITYINDEIKEVLARTLGVPIFQEQVIKLAMVAAGFTGGEADALRRAMATFGKRGTLYHFERKVVDGMLVRGYPKEFAQNLFNQMKGFAGYGFPESHSASFALLAYVSAWLKRHYPAAFCCALLNSQPMGFYSPSQLVQDVQRHDVDVRPIDVCYSHWEHTLEPNLNSTQPAIRLGLCLCKGLSEAASQRIVEVRNQLPYTDLASFTRRANMSQAELALLASSGALSSLTKHRRQAHWQALAVEEARPLLEQLLPDDNVTLPAPSEIDDIRADYNTTSVSLGRHPMAILRERIPLFQRCKTHAEIITLGHHRFVRTAGIVTGRQRPGTASGIVFLTLEDETGNSNVVIWKSVQERCRAALLKSQLMMVKGVVETDNNVVHVIAQELIDCSELLAKTNLKSRDFH